MTNSFFKMNKHICTLAYFFMAALAMLYPIEEVEVFYIDIVLIY